MRFFSEISSYIGLYEQGFEFKVDVFISNNAPLAIHIEISKCYCFFLSYDENNKFM